MNPYVEFGVVMARELTDVPQKELSEALSALCKISQRLAKHKDVAPGSTPDAKKVQLSKGLAATANGAAQAIGCELVENWEDTESLGHPLYLSVPSGLSNDWAGDRGIGIPCC